MKSRKYRTGSTHGEGKRRRMLRLWEAKPRCHWCDCLLVLLFRPHGVSFNRMKKLPNEATIDHLHDRYEGRRQVTGEEVTVLSCRECNNKRSAEATEDQPIGSLWERSGHYPGWHDKRKKKPV